MLVGLFKASGNKYFFKLENYPFSLMAVLAGIKKEDLLKLTGFKQEGNKSPYESLRLVKATGKAKVYLILYLSGKLVINGSSEEVQKIISLLKKKGLGQESKFWEEKGLIIGSDESLKGDTFGGLVVAAVKADDNIRKKLKLLGVCDSKKLSDKKVVCLAGQIRLLAECEVKSVYPEEYNQKAGLTDLLNQLHKECGSYLKPGKHVVDKFPGCKVGDIQEEKAESKYLEVAAASILARAGALKQLAALSLKAGFTLPKGSNHVQSALQELKKRGFDFTQFVKQDFKTVRELAEKGGILPANKNQRKKV